MRRSRLLALFAALALIFAACGDDDDDSVSSDETTTTVEDDDETTTTTEDDDETTTTTEDDDDEEATGGIGGIGGGDLGECAFMADFAAGFNELDAEAMFGGGEGDFGDLIASMAIGLDGVADAAPSEIQGDFRTMADGFNEAADQLQGVSLDFSDPMNMDPAVMEAFEAAGAIFEHPEFIAAGERIGDWMQDACPDLAPEGGAGFGIG